MDVKEKYRCEISETSSPLEIADLFIRLSNGTALRTVKLKKGELIPIELLDYEEVKRSRLTGSLKRCIDIGWIVVEGSTFDEKVVVATIEQKREILPAPTNPITELSAGTVRLEDVTNKISEITQVRRGDSPFPEEKPEKITETISFEASRTPNSFAITENQAKESEYDKFVKERYFKKLTIIKESTDIALLNEITSKSEYPQLIHNANMRLEELKKRGT